MNEGEKLEILNLFYAWKNDDLSVLIFIDGYSDWLLHEESGSLTNQQKEILEIINRKARRMNDRWHDRQAFISLKYDEVHEIQVINFAKVVNQACLQLKANFGVNNIQVEVPENLPDIKATWYLDRAVLNLILCPFLTSTNNFPGSVIKAFFRKDIQRVRVEIRVFIPDDSNFHLRDYPGSRLDLARQIIESHESELVIQEMGGLINFSFELPVWDG